MSPNSNVLSDIYDRITCFLALIVGYELLGPKPSCSCSFLSDKRFDAIFALDTLFHSTIRFTKAITFGVIHVIRISPSQPLMTVHYPVKGRLNKGTMPMSLTKSIAFFTFKP